MRNPKIHILIPILALLFPETIMSFFTEDQEVIAKGRTFFIIVALTEPIMALAFALGGALRGGGDPISPFIYSSFSDLFVVVGAGFLLAVPLRMGFTGIALAIAASSITRAAPMMLKFKKGGWKTLKVGG